jgi:hypothetical protein
MAPSKLRWATNPTDPRHATIEEFAAEGLTHIECPSVSLDEVEADQLLPRISMGLTIAHFQQCEVAIPLAAISLLRSEGQRCSIH